MSTGCEWDAWAEVGVSVHLRPGVELTSTVYPDEGRVVLRVRGTNFADLSLFADRADLDRLHSAVTDARDQLDTATAALDHASTDPTDTSSAGAVAADGA